MLSDESKEGESRGGYGGEYVCKHAKSIVIPIITMCKSLTVHVLHHEGYTTVINIAEGVIEVHNKL